MNIALVTPAPARSRTGNRHTALRWAHFLRRAGHRVTIAQQWMPDARTDLMLALHARRSHGSIVEFARRFPDRPLVLALTGTDVYRDIRTSDDARQSLELAHRMIVLQPLATRELPRRLHGRVNVVTQSSATRLRHAPVKHGFRLCVIGHLRDEKDPLRTLACLPYLRDGSGISVVHLGAPLDPDLGRLARDAMQTEPRYRWLGAVPHARALRWLASSHALVVSSRMEGGANVVSEAIRIGVPVLASRIPGNVGLLGADYPAYFATGNERSLARLVMRVSADQACYRELLRRVRLLRPMVSPACESRQLLHALGLHARPSTRRTGANERL